MEVLKFGGTSLGTPEKMRSLIELITDNENVIVVLSAMAGTTDSLVDITNYLSKNNKDTARELTFALEQKYKQVVQQLFKTKEYKNKAMGMVYSHFNPILMFLNGF